MKNSFEHEVDSIDKGKKIISEQDRPNLNALEQKRNEFILQALKDVIGTPELEEVMKRGDTVKTKTELVAHVVDGQIYKSHGYNLQDFIARSSKGELTPEDESIYREMIATYPTDLIVGYVKRDSTLWGKILETAYYPEHN